MSRILMVITDPSESCTRRGRRRRRIYLPGHLLPGRDRGRLIGLWEFDPETGTIAWSAWVEKDDALRRAVAETEAYVRDQLGDARSFTLDSPKSRAPRIAALRQG